MESYPQGVVVLKFPNHVFDNECGDFIFVFKNLPFNYSVNSNIPPAKAEIINAYEGQIHLEVYKPEEFYEGTNIRYCAKKAFQIHGGVFSMDEEEYLEQVGNMFNHDIELLRAHHTEVSVVHLNEEIENNIRASHVFLNKGYFLLVLKAKEKKMILFSTRNGGVINTSPDQHPTDSFNTPILVHQEATPGRNGNMGNHNQQSHGIHHVPPHSWSRWRQSTRQGHSTTDR